MHTKGPWEISIEADKTYIVGERYICDILDWSITGAGKDYDEIEKQLEAEKEANAHLIAAAPELLSALEGMIKMFALVSKKINWGASFLDADAIKAMNDAPIEARIAIGKAEGK